MKRPLALFVVVAFGFSALVGLALHLLSPPPLAGIAFSALFMFGPAVGALVARRFVVDDATQAPLDVPLGAKVLPHHVPGALGWWAVAWLAPLLVPFAALLVGALLPGVELVLDATVVLERVGAAIPADKLEEARAELAAIPVGALLAMQVLQALIAALSINAIAAFGEELGWRGFLHVHLQRKFPSLATATAGERAFWTRAVVVGALWGAWHAPLILQGHNYPQHPVLGVPLMIVFCVLYAPWFEHIRERTGSVLAVSVMHGAINASAGFAVLFLRGGNDLLVGVTGLAGFIVLAVANVVLLAVRRRAARTAA